MEEPETQPVAVSPGPADDGAVLPASAIVVGAPVRKALLWLALPVLGEQILNTVVALFDTWLAGRLSPAATSAVGLAAYVSWLASMIVMLVATGTTALVARFVGAGQPDRANHFANQSLTLACGVGVALLFFIYPLAPWLARYSNMTGGAFGMTVRYLRVDAFGHVFMSVIIVACAALRGAGDMRTPMALWALINTVNIIVSSLLVLHWRFGVTGIVAGTVAAKIVGAIVVVLLLLRGKSGLKLSVAYLRPLRDHVLRILRIGLPAGVDGAIMWSGHFAFLAIIARAAPGMLGRATFAAHIIAVRVESLVYLPAMAWAAAAATMIGQALGAGDPQRARRVGHEAVCQCGLLAVFVASVYYLAADWIFAQMSTDALVQAAGVVPFRVLTMILPLLVVSIVYIGGLRGAGDTRVPMLITVVGIAIRLTLGSYGGLVLDLGLLGAWFGMFGDMTWRAIAATGRFRGGRWIHVRV